MATAKQTIIDAAFAILNETGDPGAVSIRNVADRSHYSRGSVLHHVTSSANLLDLLHTRSIEESSKDFLDMFARLGIGRYLADQDMHWPGKQVHEAMRRQRESRPGSWELIRVHRCPDFTEADAPTAWRFIHDRFRPESINSIGTCADLIFLPTMLMFEVIEQANPEEADRMYRAGALLTDLHFGLLGQADRSRTTPK